MKVFREKLHKRVVAEQRRLKEAARVVAENNRKMEERLIAYKQAEKKRLSVPPPPPPKVLVKKTTKKQQSNSRLQERIEEHASAVEGARSTLAKFKSSHGAGGVRQAPSRQQMAGAKGAGAGSSKFTFLERQRYVHRAQGSSI